VSKYEYVDSQRDEPGNTDPVSKMCLWLDVSTSGFYHRRAARSLRRRPRRETRLVRIRHYFEASDGTYGYRRIHADLVDEGRECSPELVRHIMRDEGLIACQPRPFRVTTEADAEGAVVMSDLVKRDFTAERPGGKFVGDITYIHTAGRYRVSIKTIQRWTAEGVIEAYRVGPRLVRINPESIENLGKAIHPN
jgi:putative transposase